MKDRENPDACSCGLTVPLGLRSCGRPGLCKTAEAEARAIWAAHHTAEFTSAEDVLVWLSGFGGGENQPTVAAVREAIAFARADIADRLQTARADVYESVSRERDEASAALLTEQDRTAALRSALTRLIDAAAPHVGAEYATEEETRALRNALKNAREDMR